MLSTWLGQPVTVETAPATLLEVIEYLAEENLRLRTERDEWRPHVDFAGVLLANQGRVNRADETDPG